VYLMLWKLNQKFKLYPKCEVCMSFHYETICLELFKLKKEEKQES
jgi:hypothetical protein